LFTATIFINGLESPTDERQVICDEFSEQKDNRRY
jgi:hypothetical protein